MRLPSGPAHRSNSVDYRYGVKMAEHRGNTRRATRLAEAQPPMQVIAVSPSRAQVEALAAGSAEAQSKFLEGVGIVTTQVEHLENVLDRESAELLSCALQHQRYNEGRLTDPYFMRNSGKQSLREEVPCSTTLKSWLPVYSALPGRYYKIRTKGESGWREREGFPFAIAKPTSATMMNFSRMCWANW